MPSNPLLSIVIPVFNEQFNVRPLVDAIENHLSEYTYELIFIDDCSTDNSRPVHTINFKPKSHSNCF